MDEMMLIGYPHPKKEKKKETEYENWRNVKQNMEE